MLALIEHGSVGSIQPTCQKLCKLRQLCILLILCGLCNLASFCPYIPPTRRRVHVPSCRDITLNFASGSILSIIALDMVCNERNSTSLGQKPSCIVMHFMYKNVHYANYAIYTIKWTNLKISLTLQNAERSIAVSSMEDIFEVQ